MKCPKCGAELTGTERFCYDCGSEITKNSDNYVTPIAESTPVNETVVEQVTPVVESIPTTEVVSEQVTPVVESIPTTEVVSEQVTPVVESIPTTEVVSEQVTPVVESIPTAEVVSEQVTPTEKPKDVKSNKSIIIIGILLLLVVLGTGTFFVFKNYFIKDNGASSGDIIDDNKDKDDNQTPTTVSLVCNKISEGLNSIVEISYVDGKIENYGMSYSMNTYGMSGEQVNTYMTEYNTIYTKVSAFENESGFSISNTNSTDEEFGALTVNLYYTIKVSAVTNDKILELIDDKDLTITEKSANMKAQGYVCN